MTFENPNETGLNGEIDRLAIQIIENEEETEFDKTSFPEMDKALESAVSSAEAKVAALFSANGVAPENMVYPPIQLIFGFGGNPYDLLEKINNGVETDPPTGIFDSTSGVFYINMLAIAASKDPAKVLEEEYAKALLRVNLGVQETNVEFLPGLRYDFFGLNLPTSRPEITLGPKNMLDEILQESRASIEKEDQDMEGVQRAMELEDFLLGKILGYENFSLFIKLNDIIGKYPEVAQDMVENPEKYLPISVAFADGEIRESMIAVINVSGFAKPLLVLPNTPSNGKIQEQFKLQNVLEYIWNQLTIINPNLRRDIATDLFTGRRLDEEMQKKLSTRAASGLRKIETEAFAVVSKAVNQARRQKRDKKSRLN